MLIFLLLLLVVIRFCIAPFTPTPSYSSEAVDAQYRFSEALVAKQCAESPEQDQALDLSLPKNTPAPPDKQQYNIENTKQSQQHPETSHGLARTRPVQPPVSKASANASLVSRQVRKVNLYRCLECGKQLRSLFGLRNHHVRFHSAALPYVCRVCFRNCITNSGLIRHMRVHSGERPFKCSVCSRAFSQNSNCERHMQSHTGAKPYACEFCNKTFPRLDNLKVHNETHNAKRRGD